MKLLHYKKGIEVTINSEKGLIDLVKKRIITKDYLKFAGKVATIIDFQIKNNMVWYNLAKIPFIWPSKSISSLDGKELMINYTRNSEHLNEYGDEDINTIKARKGSLFYMNYDWNADENMGYKLFSLFGNVSHLELIKDKFSGRSKGFGFVKLSRDADNFMLVNLLNGECPFYERKLSIGIIENPQDTERITIIGTLCDGLIKLIAKYPSELKRIEWRDLERIIAHILDSIGYVVELTPPSKDKGKDIIVSFFARNRKETFYIEIKHWVSGKKVGKKETQEFLSVLINEQKTGLLLSTSGFTNNCLEGIVEFKKKDINLGDSNTISELCNVYINYNNGLFTPIDYNKLLKTNTKCLKS